MVAPKIAQNMINIVVNNAKYLSEKLIHHKNVHLLLKCFQRAFKRNILKSVKYLLWGKRRAINEDKFA
jgi:hypothetical protein